MIIDVFNYSWFLLAALACAYAVFTTKKNKDKTDDEKYSFILKQSIILCVAWVLYKIGLSMDLDYADRFKFWNELPLQPCNTVCWLAIIASAFRDKTIMAYSFYAGIIFALLALIMPPIGFYNYNLLTIRCLGFYLSHWMVIITGIQFASFGLFKINYKSAVKAFACYLAIAAIMHVINIIMRATVFPEASYYYTFGREDNIVLKMVHDFIPVNYVFLIPIAVVALGFFCLETKIINSIGLLIRKRKDRN